MTIGTELIILHTTKFAENSLVVHTLSKEWGRRSFLVRGVGKKYPPSYFLPMNVLEAQISENPKSQLYGVKSLIVKHPLIGLRNNLLKNTMTLFLSEVLFRAIREGSSEVGLFEWCEQKILVLDALQADFSNFHVRFLTELCSIMGFEPTLRPCGDELEAPDLEPILSDLTPLAIDFFRLPFEQAMLIPLNGVTRNELLSRLLKYIEFHCEASVNVKSLKVLRELYQ